MSSIILRSESGNWQYSTTTDNPIFQPILGSMLEEGMHLADELTIPGTLGQALDKNWKYIDILRQWDEWEVECSRIGKITYYRDFDVLIGKLPDMPPLVTYRDIEVLSKALVLPLGWESHVIVDESYPISERVHIMQASLVYLRAHPVSALIHRRNMRNMSRALAFRSKNPVVWATLTNEYGVDMHYHGSLLESFFRNVWLMQRDSKTTEVLNFAVLLDKIDWEALLEYTTVNSVVFLANVMLGRAPVEECTEYGLDINIYKEGLGLSWKYDVQEDNLSISHVYTKLLDFLPIDVDPKILGIDVILYDHIPTILRKIKGTDVLRDDRYVPISNIVGHINALIITKRIISAGHFISITEDVAVTRDKFPDIVELLASTIGLHALRRILLSLLHYIESGTKKIVAGPRKRKGKISENVQIEYDNLKKRVERADLFSSLLETYLEQHNGEDEGVKVLKVMSS